MLKLRIKYIGLVLGYIFRENMENIRVTSEVIWLDISYRLLWNSIRYGIYDYKVHILHTYGICREVWRYILEDMNDYSGRISSQF